MACTAPPPNRAGGSPAHGSPVSGLTSSRTGVEPMGNFKAEEPMVLKEAIGPAKVVMTPTNSLTFGSLAQNRAQAAADPSINGREGPSMTLFEVFEPSSEGRVDTGYDNSQAVAVAPLGLSPKAIFELAQALLARPTSAALKVVAEEVKALSWNRGIDHMVLYRRCKLSL